MNPGDKSSCDKPSVFLSCDKPSVPPSRCDKPSVPPSRCDKPSVPPSRMNEQGDNSFFEQVYDIVARIPYGKVVSYGQIAALLGNPRGARTVGWAMSSCPEGLPWQRVVKADGSIAGGRWAELRRELLAKEGVKFLPDGRVDMKMCAWKPRK